MSLTDESKKKAAYRAVEYVSSGMILGLGTGSTAKFAVERIAERFHNGQLKNIFGIPSSIQTQQFARQLAIPLTTLDKNPVIDLTIDGADEVDPELNLIKGGGGALLREKIIAQVSRRNVIVIDQSKLSPKLGRYRGAASGGGSLCPQNRRKLSEFLRCISNFTQNRQR